MGIVKGIGKVIGTTVLGATGVASTVLKGVFDTVGVELGSEIFGAAKNASFNGIRNMWESDSADGAMDKVDDVTGVVEDGIHAKGAEAAKQLAEQYEYQAQHTTDPEKRAALETKAERFWEKYYTNQ